MKVWVVMFQEYDLAEVLEIYSKEEDAIAHRQAEIDKSLAYAKKWNVKPHPALEQFYTIHEKEVK